MGLKFIAVSGTTNVTQNMYIYEDNDTLIVVDCGVGFPEHEMYGVDLVIPDFSYLRKNVSKFKAVLISHGHEDHMGAIPFLLEEFNVPIYSTALVAGFIEEKLSDYNRKDFKINVFDPENDVLSFGSFKITPFRVSHSVPDGVGFCFDTQEGKIFHVSDYKFDWTPVDGKRFAIDKAAILSSGGALAVVSDCLGSTSEGYTKSEKEIEKKIEAIAKDIQKKIIVTTISSNISRIQQTLNVAKKLGRKVCFVGRSITVKAEIARKLGYLHYSQDQIVSLQIAVKTSDEKMLYIISGSYGQVGSALYRVCLNEHGFLSIKEGDVVIFSSDPAPPGSKPNVDFVVDKLIELGSEVHYYDTQEDLHVSGHGSQEDIKMLFALINPSYFIPIGGTVRHMRAYKYLANDMGFDSKMVFELGQGAVVEFNNKRARVTGKIPVKDILVDGLGVGDVGNVVLRDRQILAKEGMAIVIIQIDQVNGQLLGDPEVISRGFVFEGKDKGLLVQASRELKPFLNKKISTDKRIVRDFAVDYLEKFFYRETGRRPMILPVVIEI